MKKVRVRPGRAQSALGMAFGIIFCALGIFVVVPYFGPFGFLWTIAAAAITVVNALNVFTDRGVASHEYIIDVEATESDPETPEERLEAAKRLLQSGSISQSEYEEKRKEILKDI